MSKQGQNLLEYPRYIFNRDGNGVLLKKIVNTREEHDAHAAKGWQERIESLPATGTGMTDVAPTPAGISLAEVNKLAEDKTLLIDEVAQQRSHIANLEEQNKSLQEENAAITTRLAELQVEHKKLKVDHDELQKLFDEATEELSGDKKTKKK